jgi:chaperone modulatory protein CbpM
MITLTAIVRSVPGLTEADLHHFIEAEWVRPIRRGHQPMFSELDLARIRLILDLRAELEVEERTVPLVLSLLDQLYTTRRQLRRVLAQTDDTTRARLLQELPAED